MKSTAHHATQLLTLTALLLGITGAARADEISTFRLNPRASVVGPNLQVQALVNHFNTDGQGTAEFFAHSRRPAHSEEMVRTGVPLRLAGQATAQPIKLQDRANKLTLEVDYARLKSQLGLVAGDKLCLACYFNLDSGRDAARAESHAKFGTPLKHYHIYGSTDPKTNADWTSLVLP